MSSLKPGIRKRVWSGNPSATDVAELARDAQGAIDAVDAKLQVVEFKDTIWSPPHFIDTQGRCPTAVLPGNARPSGSPTNIQLGASPIWDFFNGKVRVTQMNGPVQGTSYTFSLILFYGGS